MSEHSSSATVSRPCDGGATRPHGKFADQYAALLQQILTNEQLTGSTSCSIGLTSCARKSGVSTVAGNLAVYAAGVLDEKVLLVDANIGHPSMQKTFDTNGSPGLAQSLSGLALAMDCVQSSRIDNLFLLTTGSTRPGHWGVFGASSIGNVLRELREAFGFIVFDCPEAHEISHCYALVAKLDGIVLVVEAEKDKTEVSQRAVQHLEQAGANVMGVVFNKRRHHVPNWLYRTL